LRISERQPAPLRLARSCRLCPRLLWQRVCHTEARPEGLAGAAGAAHAAAHPSGIGHQCHSVPVHFDSAAHCHDCYRRPLQG